MVKLSHTFQGPFRPLVLNKLGSPFFFFFFHGQICFLNTFYKHQALKSVNNTDDLQSKPMLGRNHSSRVFAGNHKLLCHRHEMFFMLNFSSFFPNLWRVPLWGSILLSVCWIVTHDLKYVIGHMEEPCKQSYLC